MSYELSAIREKLKNIEDPIEAIIIGLGSENPAKLREAVKLRFLLEQQQHKTVMVKLEGLEAALLGSSTVNELIEPPQVVEPIPLPNTKEYLSYMREQLGKRAIPNKYEKFYVRAERVVDLCGSLLEENKPFSERVTFVRKECYRDSDLFKHVVEFNPVYTALQGYFKGFNISHVGETTQLERSLVDFIHKKDNFSEIEQLFESGKSIKVSLKYSTMLIFAYVAKFGCTEPDRGKPGVSGKEIVSQMKFVYNNNPSHVLGRIKRLKQMGLIQCGGGRSSKYTLTEKAQSLLK